MQRRNLFKAGLAAMAWPFCKERSAATEHGVQIDMTGLKVTASSGKTSDDRPTAVIEFPIGSPGEAGEISLDWLRWEQVEGSKYGILQMRLAVDGDVMRMAVDGTTKRTAYVDFGMLAGRLEK